MPKVSSKLFKNALWCTSKLLNNKERETVAMYPQPLLLYSRFRGCEATRYSQSMEDTTRQAYVRCKHSMPTAMWTSWPENTASWTGHQYMFWESMASCYPRQQGRDPSVPQAGGLYIAEHKKAFAARDLTLSKAKPTFCLIKAERRRTSGISAKMTTQLLPLGTLPILLLICKVAWVVQLCGKD